MNDRLPLHPSMSSPKTPKPVRESGKVGVALLAWLLGVPGILILLYLILA
jgi:hypothetical protein